MVLAVSSAYQYQKKQYNPCKQLVLYFHDIIYKGQNKENATSAMVTASQEANLTTPEDQFHFRNITVFDDPMIPIHHPGQQPSLDSCWHVPLGYQKHLTAWLGF
ncbi:hypothetical protein REPUB_Repub07fG0187600 [Reevesia pubescens]